MSKLQCTNGISGNRLFSGLLTILFAVTIAASTASAQFVQGFETDNVWGDPGTDPTRVAAGTNGIPSRTGSFHAEVDGGEFTRWGGYSPVFPANGYTTSIAVYLDMAGGYANDTRFNWTSAVSDTTNAHRRDFIFHGGFYSDAGPHGSGNRFVFSVSNNSPGNPRGGSPVVVTTSGWYRMKHTFFDGGAGQLAVKMQLINPSGVVVGTWTRSDPSDIIGTTVGGNRYGWFIGGALAFQFPFLAIDDSELELIPSQAAITVSPANSNGWILLSENTPGGSGSFVHGPGTPPLGSGSVRLEVPTAANGYILAREGFAGTRLDQITSLSYSTYRTAGGSAQAPSFFITIDDDVTDADNTFKGRLSYEPYYTETVNTGVWQTWNNFAATGNWWFSNGGLATASGCAIGSPCSLAQVLAAFPNAGFRNTAGSPMGFKAGSGWTGFDGNVDNLQIGIDHVDTVFNFDPDPAVLVVDTDGMASATDCSASDPAHMTIQAAVTAANVNDIIKVCPGTYPEAVNVNKSVTINGPNSGVTACGVRGPEAVVGNSTGAFNLSSNNAVVDGFTAQGNTSGAFFGSGVVTGPSTSGTQLRNNIIQNNIVGLFMGGDNAVIQGNLFRNNNVTGPTSGTAIYTDQFVAGVLTNVSINANCFVSQTSSNNIGINFASTAAGSQNNLTITNNTFDGLRIPLRLANVESSTISGNEISNSVAATGAGISISGGSNNLTIMGNTIRDGAGTGIAIAGTAGANIAINFNRIVRNLSGVSNVSAIVNAENNWWGCNYGPGSGGAGCVGTPNGITGAGAGSVTAAPWLTLTSSASPGLVIIPATSAVTSGLTINSASMDTSGGGTVIDGIPVTFVGTNGTVAPSSSTTTAGVTGTTFTPTTAGDGVVATTIDEQTVNAPITVLATCPTVSTDNTTSFTSHPALTGVAKTIPVNTTDLTSRGVIAADFTFTYDPAVLSGNPAHISVTNGTVVPDGGHVITINKSTPGTIVVSIFNGAIGGEFTGAGTLVDINMRVIGPQNSTSPLTLTNFRYNNGLVCADPVLSGTLTVISGTISGTITTAINSVPVQAAVLNAPGTPTVTASTNASGFYEMSGFGPGSYTVTPSRAAYMGGMSNPNNGVMSDDPSLIAQHVVGLITFTPDQIAAANVSGLATVSSFDAALVAQWIVGVNNPINQTGQWKFTPVDRTYPNVIVDITGEDYTAILMGDVNGSWVTSPNRAAPLTDPERIKNAVKTSVASVSAQQGETVTVPLSIENLKGEGVTSYQFDIEYDANVLAPADVSADLAGTVGEGLAIAFNTPEKGILKVVVYGASPVTGDGIFANLRFTAVGAGGSSSPLAISQFSFNSGTADVVTRNGKVRVLSVDMDTDGISGRLLTAYGERVADTRVVLTSTAGTSIVAASDADGYFEFIGLTTGETYTVSVMSKRFTFAQRMVSVTGGVTELSMIADQ